MTTSSYQVINHLESFGDDVGRIDDTGLVPFVPEAISNILVTSADCKGNDPNW